MMADDTDLPQEKVGPGVALWSGGFEVEFVLVCEFLGMCVFAGLLCVSILIPHCHDTSK